MRYLAILLIFICATANAQVVRTAGIAIGTAVPTHTPSAQGALKYYQSTTGTTYKWFGGAWVVEATGTGSDDQVISIDSTGRFFTITLEDGGTVTWEDQVGINTDNQIIEIDSTGRVFTITLEDGGQIVFEDQIGTDNQTIDTFIISSNNLLLSLEGDGEPRKSVDLSPFLDNTDNQTISLDSTGRYFTVTLENGGQFTFEDRVGDTNTDDQQISIDSLGRNFTINLENGGSVGWTDQTGTDNQTIDTFDINANIARLSLEGDSEPFHSIDLSPYLDNTDAQTLSFSAPNLSISGGNSVNISGINTDNQIIDTFVIVGNTVRLSLEDDAQPFKSIDLSPYLDNTDNQTVDNFSLGGTTLTLELEDDGEAPYTVDLSSLLDNTDNQVVDTFTIVSNVLRLSLEDDAQPFKSVDLSPYLDNTDAQTLSFSAPNLSISGGNSVNISGINTDNQQIDTFELDGTDLILSLERDGEPALMVDLSSLQDGTGTDDQVISIDSTGRYFTINLEDGGSVTWQDQVGDTNTDDQAISIDSTGRIFTITLEDGGQVVFEDRVGDVNTDNQKIDTFDIDNNTLRISLEADAEPAKTVNLAPYLDNTDDQAISIDSAGNWYTVTLEDGGTFSFTKDTDTQLSEEQVEDYVGGMVTGNTETLITVTYQDGDGTIDFVVEDDLSLYDNTTSGFITSQTDDQRVDTFTIVSNVLRLSLESDAEPFKSVDLSPYLDNTDNQTVDNFSLGGTILTLELEDDGEAAYTVDLASLQDGTGTDDQGLTIGGSGPTYTIDIEDGADVTIAAGGIVSLSEGTANVLTITATELDGDPTNELQQIDTFTIVSNILRASLSDDDVPFKSVDLSPYLDNTDSQGFIVTDDGTTFDFDLSGTASDFSLTEGSNITLSRTGNDVTISAGGGGTDDQDLTLTGSGPSYVIDIEDGDDITISVAGIATLSEPNPNELLITVTEVDGSTTNEIQQLTASDDGTTFTFALGSSTESINLTEGSNITMTRSGDDVTISATDTQLSEEQVEDFVGGMVTGNTETLITVTYQDADGTIDFVVEPDLSNYNNDAGFITSAPATDLTIGGSGPTYIIESSTGADVTVSAAGIATLSEPNANELRITATEAQTFSGTDDGTTFTWQLSGAATHASIKEGSNVNITRSGTEFTINSTGSADNWGSDVVNTDGTLSGDGTSGAELKVDTTIIATKDFVFKGKVTQEASETIKTTDFTAVKFVIHPVDCSAGVIVVTPPATPAIGDRFGVVDCEANAATNNITVDFTTPTQKLYTAVQDYIINVDGGYVEFIYMGTTTGWVATKG